MTFAEQLRENLAAESDARTTAIDEVWWGETKGLMAFVMEDFAWAFEEAGLDPAAMVAIQFVVCPLCDGKGKHVNPSIDAHGLTRADFDEDPDFEESYFRGDYDEPCNLCFGEKVVPVPLDPNVSKAIEMVVRERYEYRSEQLAEIRFGC